MPWTNIPTFTVGQVLTSSTMNNMRSNANIGHLICTSASRPAGPDTGSMIYETDTLRTLVWNGTAWTYTSTLVVTSTTRPASVPTGTSIYETDTGYSRVYDGSLWRHTGPVPSVTSLPSSPVDGDEIVYTANGTLGIRWHFKYRSASASSYKWEFVGGAPLRSETDYATWGSWTVYNSNTHVATSIQVTIPALAGDYQFTGEISSYCASLSSILVVRTTDGYGNAWNNYHAAKYDAEDAAYESISSTRTITCVANQTVHIRIANSNTGQPASTNNGNIWAIPVRVG